MGDRTGIRSGAGWRWWTGAWLILVLAAGCSMAVSAQENEKLPPGIRKTEAGYLHVASNLELQLPRDWQVKSPEPVQNFPAFSLRRRLPSNEKETVEVSITLVPMGELPLSEIVAEELKVLQLIYGEKQVGNAEEMELPTQPPRKGYRIELRDGPSRNGREAGVVYLFATGDDPKSAWRVRVRAVWNRSVTKEAAAETEKLLPHLHIAKPQSP